MGSKAEGKGFEGIKGKEVDEKMMYRCNRCGNVFADDEFNFVIETHGLDSPPYERIAVCPYCGSDFYEEVNEEDLEEE